MSLRDSPPPNKQWQPRASIGPADSFYARPETTISRKTKVAETLSGSGISSTQTPEAIPLNKLEFPATLAGAEASNAYQSALLRNQFQSENVSNGFMRDQTIIYDIPVVSDALALRVVNLADAQGDRVKMASHNTTLFKIPGIVGKPDNVGLFDKTMTKISIDTFQRERISQSKDSNDFTKLISAISFAYMFKDSIQYQSIMKRIKELDGDMQVINDYYDDNFSKCLRLVEGLHVSKAASIAGVLGEFFVIFESMQWQLKGYMLVTSRTRAAIGLVNRDLFRRGCKLIRPLLEGATDDVITSVAQCIRQCMYVNSVDLSDTVTLRNAKGVYNDSLGFLVDLVY